MALNESSIFISLHFLMKSIYMIYAAPLVGPTSMSASKETCSDVCIYKHQSCIAVMLSKEIITTKISITSLSNFYK